ncbi:bifunctional ADP-dependent NAD(P)H-hydrate dehydratase/NAD(P)H-hydrate epimerase [Caloramator australicus]|uniref:Bifunctional NAD(P)H-hydrate repair enzyme n=1 Tax=Caloramator australicus RC3 TaxID=857293 RepID=I7LJV4_9CLOT|nr:bifunctional ADP-dependent NAD(P)H-hydrate dehydratase/NAD(P)H-hydrate epimerase [Caloramator australicus]CCJ33973.1 YjeF protein, function unknown [Caloramator australicus RC3]
MKVVNANEMREIDKRAIEKYKIPGIILMENAAYALLEEIERLNGKRITIVCGTGNNGGDGFALARLLLIRGYDVEVFCFSDPEKVKGDARINLDILLNMGIKVYNDLNKLENSIRYSDVVVDALLGTGLSGEVKEELKNVIDAINKGRLKLSVDIPSGINSDTGSIMGTCVFADITVTFECLKLGHILSEGKEASGKVIVKKIGIPVSCIEEQSVKIFTSDKEYPISLIKKRRLDTNKGDYGKVAIIGGNYKMSGAIILALKSALRSGAGLVCGVFPKTILDRVGALVPEAVYFPCEEKHEHIFLDDYCLNILFQKSNAIAFGVGIGNFDELLHPLQYILEHYEGPLVIDADGLNVLSRNKTILKSAKSKVILTPHPGEMSRLTGYDIDYINKNRINVAKSFAKEYNSIVLLKGSSTVVTDGEFIYINRTGNPGMATAGSGDVLTGVLVSLLGQGYSPFEAAILGSFIHGISGDRAYQKHGYGLTAMDLVDNLGFLFKKDIGSIKLE